MVKKHFFLISLFIACACTNKAKDPVIDTFLAMANNIVSMKITYGDRRLNSKRIIDTTISNLREIEDMKNWLKQSSKSDTCYHLTGTIAFINDNGENFSIDFGLASDCPSFYYFVEGKPITLRMPYQSGMYLGELMH